MAKELFNQNTNGFQLAVISNESKTIKYYDNVTKIYHNLSDEIRSFQVHSEFITLSKDDTIMFPVSKDSFAYRKLLNKQTIHHIKLCQPYYDAVKNGEKRFELRFNDRNYQNADILAMHLYDGENMSDEAIQFQITSILKDYPGLEENYVIMSLSEQLY